MANGADCLSPDALEAALRAAKAAGKKHTLALVARGGTQVYVAMPTDLSLAAFSIQTAAHGKPRHFGGVSFMIPKAKERP